MMQCDSKVQVRSKLTLVLTVFLILCLWQRQFLVLHITFTHPSELKVV